MKKISESKKGKKYGGKKKGWRKKKIVLEEI
jgi:hypothetical protein